MPRTLPWMALFACALLLILPGHGQAADPGAGREPLGGLAITLGPTDGSREVALAEAGRFVVVHVTDDGETAIALRRTLAGQGRAGVVTVVENVEPGKLPFIEDLVALAVVEGPRPPTDAELLRVLRPGGVARLRGSGGERRLVKSWPDTYAPWTHFQRDASFNEVTPDRAVGVPAGVQWVADPIDPNRPDRIGVRIVDEVCVAVDFHRSGTVLIARDGFSGIPLWSVDLSNGSQGQPYSQYGLIAAEGRVYVHGYGERFARSFDLRTGAPLVTYDQGLAFDHPLDAKGKPSIPSGPTMAQRSRRDLVHRGRLIQIHGATICALDVATGRRLWQITHPQGKGWERPAVDGDTLVVAESTKPALSDVRKISGYSASWTIEVEALAGISVADGATRWRTALPKPGYPLDNCARDGRYLIAFATAMRGTEAHAMEDKKPPIPTTCVSMRDGAVLWHRDINWGGGHPPHLMATSDRVWLTSHFGGIGYPLSGAGEETNRTALTSRHFSLWGCNTTWMSETFLFSRLSVTELATGRIRLNSAARSTCVFGSTPANGLLFTTAHGCGCHGTINGTVAVHSRDLTSLRTPWAGRRLIAGGGRPSTAPGGAPAADEWPLYLRDSARSNWVDGSVRADLAQAWTLEPPASKAPKWQATQWSNAIQRVGPATAITAAEGVVAGAWMDQHTVFAADPATGTVRWTRTLDSAIDSPPTIHRGVLYVGTRGGWVWALGRDDGAVIWRFLAAPHQRLTVINGWIEAAWPVNGTIALHDGRLLVTAGRSVELDEGVFWWSLDPATGEVAKSGRIHDDDPWYVDGKSRRGNTRLVGINSPLIVNGDFAMMAPTAFRPSDGSLPVAGKDYAMYQGDTEAGRRNPGPVPSMYGLLYDGTSGGTRAGSSIVFGGYCGRMYAYRGSDFVGVGMDAGTRNARGGPGGAMARLRRLPDGQEAAVEGYKWYRQSEQVWSKRLADDSSALAVAGDTVVAGYRGKSENEGWLGLFAYADGAERGKLALPAPAVFGGVSVAKGAVYVACRNGAIVAFR